MVPSGLTYKIPGVSEAVQTWMYRALPGQAFGASCANVALPGFGCLMAPRRYTTPLLSAHAGVPVTSLLWLADFHPLISGSGCQSNVVACAGALRTLPCDGKACAGAATAAVPTITVIAMRAGAIKRAARRGSDARCFMIILWSQETRHSRPPQGTH
jgi:hypothetical protein